MPSFSYPSFFKKSLPYFFIIVIFLIGFFGFTEKTNAQFCWKGGLIESGNVGQPMNQPRCATIGGSWQNPGQAPPGAPNGPGGSGTVPTPGSGSSGTAGGAVDCSTKGSPGSYAYDNCMAAAANRAVTPPPADDEDVDDCSWRKPSTWGGCILSSMAGFVLMLSAFVLWLAGAILNFVLDETIVKMSANVQSFDGINIAWKVIRDLMNIVFIFMLIWEGLKMIISLGNSTQVKKIIGMIILSSLLINFSLFFTKVMIDASNIVTIGLYDSIIDNSTTAKAAVPGSSSGGTTGYISGLSVPFMSAMGLTNIYSLNTFSGIDLGGTFNVVIFKLLGSFLFIIASFVFFAVSILFVIRYITLLFLLMLSPIAYMGMALPSMKTYSTQWWSSFKGQLIFPPVYMLMTLVILTLMTAPGFSTSAPSPGGATPGTPGFLTLIFNFAVVIGLTVLSLIAAKKTASEGSDLIKKATGGLSKFAGGTIMGGAAAIGRRTVGARANRMAQDKDLMDAAAKGNLGAQAKLASYRKVASSSFDLRSSKIGEMASKQGLDLGKGTAGIPFLGNVKAGQGGYAQQLKDTEKKEKSYIESLKPTKEQEDDHVINAKNILKESTPEAKARMDAIRLKDEEDRKKKYDSIEAQAELDAKKKPLVETRDVAKKQAEEAEAKVKDVEAKVTAAETKVEDAQKEYERIEREERRAGGDAARVKAAGDALISQKATLDLERSTLDAEKVILQEKVKAHKEAADAIAKIDNDVVAARKIHKSEEHENLIKTSEGKRSLNQERVANYATTLDKKEKTGILNPARMWRGGPQANKAAAKAVRDTTKEETEEQKIIKQLAKLEKKRRAKIKKGELPPDEDDEEEAEKPPEGEKPKEESAE